MAQIRELTSPSRKLCDPLLSYLLSYFYPADFTGGCTKQACAYRDHQKEFEKLGVGVIGISGDSAENHKAFKEAYNLHFKLLADPNGDFAKAFGVPTVYETKKVKATVLNKEFELERTVHPTLSTQVGSVITWREVIGFHFFCHGQRKFSGQGLSTEV